jgi:hypothetical protein
LRTSRTSTLYLAVSCWSASQRPVGTSTCCW